MKLKSLGILVVLMLLDLAVRAQCAGTSSYTVNPQPSPSGTYPPNTVVTVCFTMVGYTQTNANWVDGFEVQLGPGWLPGSLTPTVPPTSQGGGGGQWLWRTSVTGSNTGNTNGPGFFYDLNNDGNPGNDFGDNSSTGTWTFCFTVTTGSTGGTALNIGIDILSDSEIGSWTTSNLCGGPPVVAIPPSVVIASSPCSVTASYTGSRCEGATGSLNVTTFTGATTYQWSGPNSFTANTQTAALGPLTALSSGTYNVTVSSGTCTATASVSVATVTTAQITLTPTPITCFGLNNGSVSSAIVPARPYTYAWSGTAQVTANINNLTAGNYTLTVTDTSGCTATASTTVTQPSAPLVAFAGNDTVIVSGNSANIGVANATTGGVGPYNFSWTPATVVCNTCEATQTSPVVTTDYILCVTDANTCSDCDTVRVRVIYGPLAEAYSTVQGGITITPDSISVCRGTTLNIGGAPTASLGNPPYSYRWTPATNLSNDTVANPTVQNIGTTTTYIITVIDQAGLIGRDTLTIVVPTDVVGTANITPVSCFGGNNGAIDLSVNGGVSPYTYFWNTGLSSEDLSNLITGNYTVTITDNLGCRDTATFNVSQPTAALRVGAAVITPVSCFSGSNGALDINPTGGTIAYSYVWSNSTFNQDLTGLTAGSYTVTVTDNRGCVDSATFTVTQPATAVQVDSITKVDVLCFGQSTGSVRVFASQGTPPYAYGWSNSGSTTAQNLNVPAGNYTVTVTDNNGCTVSASTTVLEPGSAFTLGNPLVTDALCAGSLDGSVTANPAGGVPPYTYLWNNNTTNITISNVSAGSYSLTATDNNGCTATGIYQVNEPSPLVIAPDVTDNVCYGGATGAIDAAPSGATAPYSFVWSNSQNTQVITGLTIGTYTVTVTDNNGCSASASATITQPDSLTISAVSTRVTCVDRTDATITITATGGTAAYNYGISQQGGIFVTQSAPLFTGLTAGVYTYRVEDANGCTKQSQVLVDNALADSIVVEVDSVTCYRLDDGVVRVYGLTSFNSVYRYSIDRSPLQFSNDFIGISAGLHEVLVVNAFGCETRIPVLMSEPKPILAEVNPDTINIGLGDAQGVVVRVFNIDSTRVSYVWEPREGLSCFDCFNPVVSPYKTTEYTVTVSEKRTDGRECTATAKLTALVGEAQKVFVPNTFSPNGDGVNDVFLVFGTDIKSMSLKIFNRWGEKVFESTNQNFGWDGQYRGDKATTGVYSYYAKIRMLDDSEVMEQGTLTLIR